MRRPCRRVHHQVRVLAVLSLLGAVVGGGAALGKDWHYKIPPFDCIHPDLHVPPVALSTTELWVFSSVVDQTVTDPTRPPWVLGSSGPWNITTTTTDPFGVSMPFLGTHFTLEPGGVPVGPEGAWFITATLHIPDGVTEVVADYWRLSDGQIGTASAVPMEIIAPPVPDGMQAPEAYWFIVNSIPEPATRNLLLVLGVLCMSCRRWWRSGR
jgi:hypothetical protein